MVNVNDKFLRQIRNQVIKDSHIRIKYLDKIACKSKDNLKALLPKEKFDKIVLYQPNLNKKYNLENNELKEKFEKLQTKKELTPILNQHKMNNKTEDEDPWLLNCTDIDIPDTVKDILRLGEKFSSSFLTKKSQQVYEIVKNLEANIEKIPEKAQDEFRHKILSLSTNFSKTLF